MDQTGWYCAAIAAIAVFLVLPTFVSTIWQERKARREREAAEAEGRLEPVTILPFVDPGMCMGSGACVTACPEKVLRVLDGQAVVVDAGHCVGHGACVAACPVGAIRLQFGSERRGIDVPEVRPDFQSNVPGLWIAGELGGMGLVANAVEQGRQAIDAVIASQPRAHPGGVDVVVVGAGPAGLGAGLRALEKGLSHVVLEQDEFGGAIRHYPRQKLVMTRPMDLPGYGKVRLTSARKEELVALFEDVVRTTGLRIAERERVLGVTPYDDGTFLVKTDRRELEAARVVLAVGRRGTPRRLDVPGEDQEKVAYRLVDPTRYTHAHLLVVGGGDSAIEAALALAEQPGNRVTLSYRGKVIDRPKKANRDLLAAAEADGRVVVLLGSQVTRVDLDRVALDQGATKHVLANDYVFVLVGGVLPTEFLQAAGVRIATHYGGRVVEREPTPGVVQSRVPADRRATPGPTTRPATWNPPPAPGPDRSTVPEGPTTLIRPSPFAGPSDEPTQPVLATLDEECTTPAVTVRTVRPSVGPGAPRGGTGAGRTPRSRDR